MSANPVWGYPRRVRFPAPLSLRAGALVVAAREGIARCPRAAGVIALARSGPSPAAVVRVWPNTRPPARADQADSALAGWFLAKGAILGRIRKPYGLSRLTESWAENQPESTAPKSATRSDHIDRCVLPAVQEPSVGVRCCDEHSAKAGWRSQSSCSCRSSRPYRDANP